MICTMLSQNRSNEIGCQMLKPDLSVLDSWLFISTLLICGMAQAEPVMESKLNLQSATCQRVTIERLWENPGPYGGKTLCLSGFLGRMVAYGEDSADLFATREEAKTRDSEHYVTISLPLTMKVQEELAKYSERKLDVAGIFQFDPKCWPKSGETESRFKCFPSRPMQLLKPEIALARAN